MSGGAYTVPSFREWACIAFGSDVGNRMADYQAEAIGRAMDETVLYGTHYQPVQENEMKAEQIMEVSDTVDAGLTDPDRYEGLGDAEKLGLIVGAAYGQALAERDEARALVGVLGKRLDEALTLLDDAVRNWPETTWATDSHALGALVQGIETLRAVDSDPTPTPED